MPESPEKQSPEKQLDAISALNLGKDNTTMKDNNSTHHDAKTTCTREKFNENPRCQKFCSWGLG